MHRVIALALPPLLACLLLAACPPVQAAPARDVAEQAASCADVGFAKTARPQRGPDPADRLSPPNPDGPTPVAIGFQVRDVRGIDPLRSEFRLRGYFHVTWCDPRLAFDAEQDGAGERVFAGESAMRLVDGIWYPAAFPVNEVDEVNVTERLFRIGSDGTVRQDLNVDVLLETAYDLRRFPFDRQTLELQIESFAWDADVLRVIADQHRIGFADGLVHPEWTLLSVTGRSELVESMRSETPYSRFVVAIEVARRPGFYVWKVFLPLIVIVVLSWSVFWMPKERLASRSRITATGILTIVAYQFVFAGDLPRVGYLTLLDRLMIASFGLLAVTVLQSMIVDRHQDDAPELALRIDHASRWLFPLIYALVWWGLVAFA